MPADDSAARLDALLAQHAWVRALARTLVRDDASADDLAQDAWLAALRSPPRNAAAVRAWFAAVLRNSARQQHRGGARRATREAAAARPESEPSAHDVVTRAEEHGRVVREVLALDEPFRTAVLLRFFDELPPREIAARTGVPVETARSRVQRGLARLRERLDGAHGADGISWRAALLPLAGLPTAALTPWSGAGGTASGGMTSATTSALTTGALTMAKGVTAAVGVIALAAGGAIGWIAGAGDRGDSENLREELGAARLEAETARASAKTADDALRQRDSRIAALERERGTLSKERDAAAEKADAVAAELQTARAELEKLAPATAASPKPAGPTFAYAEYADALGKVDWKSVAEHMGAMPPILEEIVAAIRDGKPVPAEAAGDVQKHNGPLVTIALQLAGKLPGTGANGTFTHPAFATNALAATLEEVGKPLSGAQRAAFEEIGQRFSEEDRRRLAGYDDTTFLLRKLTEEGDLRGRFFEAVRKVLTKDQLATISPEATRDRLAVDLWSSGIFWLQFARPVDQDKLVEELSRRVTSLLKLTGGTAERANAVVADWASRLPEALREREVDALERAGWLRVPTVQLAAGEMRQLVERLATDLALEGDALAAARNFGQVAVPMPGAGDN